jgi:hypothetical protein
VNESVIAASARVESFADKSHQGKPGWNTFIRHVGRYGTDYISRAITARLALGANPPEDTIYMSTFTDRDSRALEGSAQYRMHFDRGQTPPVDAFWLFTAYDKDGYFVDNPLDRYAIGDRDRLNPNSDGSIDLYIQSENPGLEQESNWLPSGEGPLSTFLSRRFYPLPQIGNGKCASS